MLNYETILSSYDDRLTLLQWLKKVEAALAGASLDNFAVSYEGNGEYKFKAHFADGSEVESNLVALQGVENVYIAAGNELHFVLTDGEDINAGNILLSGTLLLDSLSVTNDITCDTLEQSSANWGGSFNLPTALSGGLTLTNIYNRCEVINNVLYVVINVIINNPTSAAVTLQYVGGVNFSLPNEYASKILDFNGVSADGAGAQAWIMSSAPGCVKETTGSVPTGYGVKSNATIRIELYNNNTANAISINLASDNSVSYSNGRSVFITARAALTLI